MAVSIIPTRDVGDLTQYEDDLESAGSTTPQRFSRVEDGVIVQLSGTATAITAIVERSTRDPAVDANWAPVEADPITGDLTDGIPPKRYWEPGIAFWRIRFTTMTGGSVQISMLGGKP